MKYGKASLESEFMVAMFNPFLRYGHTFSVHSGSGNSRKNNLITLGTQCKSWIIQDSFSNASGTVWVSKSTLSFLILDAIEKGQNN